VKAAQRWTEIHLGRSSGQKPPKFGPGPSSPGPVFSG
jgi:hypothetical protein